MQVERIRVFRIAGLVTSIILGNVALVLAQGAFGTFNGRLVDQADAVLPGATITATNANTNVARTTVTNDEGLYSLPGLEPGVYTVKAELSGFATSTRNGVTLVVNQTITVDIKMGVAGVSESVTVSGAIPLIEVTQSRVAATIRTQEVESIPLLTRNLNGLLELLPGSKPVADIHPLKRQIGSVSFGGSTGRNNIPVVDGGDNRDILVGGPMMSFTVEGIGEFQVASHQFSAADGRTGGAAVTVLTKSGGNAFNGSAFFLARDRSMTAKDYFTARDNLLKLPYSRQQFGGSVGGPIVRNRAFFFAAVEGIHEDTSITVPDRQYSQLQLLVPFGAEIAHSIDKPYHDALYTTKVNFQLNQNQSLIVRVAGQQNRATNGGKLPSNDLSGTQLEKNKYFDAVAQHSWTIGNRVLNQFTAHYSYDYSTNDYSGLSGGPTIENWPNVTPLPVTRNLIFPTVTIGTSGGYYDAVQDLRQVKDNLTVQLGSHALKMGGEFSSIPRIGSICCMNWGQFTFFDDPSVIVSNSNGRYPQGFQTPGIVSQWIQGAVHSMPVNSGTNRYGPEGIKQAKAYFQDDWRMGRLTLNLGLRYDVDINFYDQRNLDKNLTGQALRAIGNPYGGFPHTPTKDFSPRLGFAYDMRGDGRRVLRGGYGMYFDGTGLQTHFQTFLGNRRPYSINAVLVNSAIGTGQLANYRFGIDPPPPEPPSITTGGFPPGQRVSGAWIDPNIKDPVTHQAHIGYSHELAPGTVLSVDYSHVVGLNDFKDVQINTIQNGVRSLAPALAAVYGDPNLIGPLQIQSSINRSRYDELAVQFERRYARAVLRMIYTFSGAFAYAGTISGSASTVPPAQDANNLFGPGEWGPTPADERHRVVMFGVFELPGGVQVSPVFQAATARPYNLLAGTDLNSDGQANDRYLNPATGQQVSVNSQRGDPFTLLDVRVTKFFTIGQTRRKLSVFAEFFNLLNTANFGASYNGNGRSTLFKQPIGFIPGSGYPFQVQLGGRFTF